MSLAERRILDTRGASIHDLHTIGLGGTAASVVLGLNPWTSPLELYEQIVDDLPAKKETWPMKRGKALEGPLAEWFQETTGMEVHEEPFMLQHPDYPWMVANIDRWIPSQDIGLECKTGSPFAIAKWRDGDAPIEYVLQCQQYMAVTGAASWWLVYALDGHDPEAILLERDESLIAAIVEAERTFWHDHVLARKPPLPDHSDSSRKALEWMFRNAVSQSAVELSDEADVWIDTKREAARIIKEAKEQESFAKNMILAMLEGNEVGLRDGQVVVTWKANKKGARTLLVKGASGDE